MSDSGVSLAHDLDSVVEVTILELGGGSSLYPVHGCDYARDDGDRICHLWAFHMGCGHRGDGLTGLEASLERSLRIELWKVVRSNFDPESGRSVLPSGIGRSVDATWTTGTYGLS